jgi:hypothetical protein
MDDYIRAYNAAMREWNKEFHGHAVAPKPECMSLGSPLVQNLAAG